MPAILGFQLVAAVVLLFALYRTVRKFRDRTIDVRRFFSWLVLWLGALLLVVWPNLTSRAARLLGVTRGVDLVTYLAVMILFYLVFRVLVKIDSLEQEITKVVRAMALKETGEVYKKSDPTAPNV